MNQIHLDTARLLVQVAPLVFADNVFALKGGTAINLFLRDMPRLSVDLDLVFVDHRLGRDEALAMINDAIRRRSAKRAKLYVAPQSAYAHHDGRRLLDLHGDQGAPSSQVLCWGHQVCR